MRPGRSQHQVNGFSALEERAFRALPFETVTERLDLVALHLASREGFQGFLGSILTRVQSRCELLTSSAVALMSS